MHFALVIASVLFASKLVYSAPTALDAATLLKNGQEAQKLNAQFQTIKISDSCDGGPKTACVGNAISNCVNNAWNATDGACSRSQQCFAIPNVKSVGTILTCTSEKSALSIIDASGAKGGITGADTSGSTNGTSSSSTVVIGKGYTSTTRPSAASTSNLPATRTSPDIVTVTVTVTPTETTLPITIRTISPQDASSIFSSILAQGQPTSSTVSSASATSTDSATSTATTSVPPSTIILLTAAPETSVSAAPPVSAAAASISASSGSSGGNGY